MVSAVLVAVLLVAVLLTAALRASADAPPERHPGAIALNLRPPEVVRISGGFYTRGASREDIAFAHALCERYAAGLELCGHPAVLEELTAEFPQRRVFVGPFGIDRFEVTNAAYRRCEHAGACAPSRLSTTNMRVAADDHPVAAVTFDEARAFCEFAGGRLPTESEWEYAARGGREAVRFPWGAFYNDRATNHGSGTLQTDDIDGFEYSAPVDAFPSDVSAFGVVGMAGNVAEWTSDRFTDANLIGSSVDPVGPPGRSDGGERTVRGGSFVSAPFQLRVTHRRGISAGLATPQVGFRCAYD